MKKHGSILYWAMLFSFFGSLPPGIVNLAAAQINLEQGKSAAILYSFGSMLAEVLVVRIALLGIKQILRYQPLFYVLEMITAVMLLSFTMGCFILATSMPGIAGEIVHVHLPPLRTGILLSLFNPVHIPFWLGWAGILLEKRILYPGRSYYNWMITGICIGTIAGFIRFIYTGEFVLYFFNKNQFVIYLSLGLLLSVASLLYVRKLFRSSSTQRYAKLISGLV